MLSAAANANKTEDDDVFIFNSALTGALRTRLATQKQGVFDSRAFDFCQLSRCFKIFKASAAPSYDLVFLGGFLPAAATRAKALGGTEDVESG